MAITTVPVRATISVGGMSISTPFILSFSVRRSRGQISTFDASLKVAHGEFSGLTGGTISIKAGIEGSEKQIFTGIVRNAKLTPCWDDPNYVMLTISGNDVLSLLQGKKYTRRCRATRGQFCVITSVARKGLKSGKFTYDSENVFELDEGDLTKNLPSSGATTPGPEAIVVGTVNKNETSPTAIAYVIPVTPDTTTA